MVFRPCIRPIDAENTNWSGKLLEVGITEASNRVRDLTVKVFSKGAGNADFGRGGQLLEACPDVQLIIARNDYIAQINPYPKLQPVLMRHIGCQVPENLDSRHPEFSRFAMGKRFHSIPNKTKGPKAVNIERD
jgi:hypothetical protein